MKHNTATAAQHAAADPQRIVEYMTPPKPTSQAAKLLALHPHMVCNSWIGPRIKGIPKGERWL